MPIFMHSRCCSVQPRPQNLGKVHICIKQDAYVHALLMRHTAGAQLQPFSCAVNSADSSTAAGTYVQQQLVHDDMTPCRGNCRHGEVLGLYSNAPWKSRRHNHRCTDPWARSAYAAAAVVGRKPTAAHAMQHCNTKSTACLYTVTLARKQ